eukprot:6136099-Amphidinium_carterae.1
MSKGPPWPLAQPAPPPPPPANVEKSGERVNVHQPPPPNYPPPPQRAESAQGHKAPPTKVVLKPAKGPP